MTGPDQMRHVLASFGDDPRPEAARQDPPCRYRLDANADVTPPELPPFSLTETSDLKRTLADTARHQIKIGFYLPNLEPTYA